MFDENQLVLVKWNSKIKSHYVERGYHFTKMGDEFEVKAKDLTIGSHVMVSCTCDYCGKQYELMYKLYLHSIKTGLLACDSCQRHKHKSTIQDRRTESFGRTDCRSQGRSRSTDRHYQG